MAKYIGDLEKTCSVIWRKHVQRLGENMFYDLEKTCSTTWRKRVRQFGENVFGDLEKTCSTIWRKRVRRPGENVFDAIMAISYWSSLWSSIELDDRKWRLNHNGEKVETSYGDQNFIHHKAESTYLGRFKDRNI